MSFTTSINIRTKEIEERPLFPTPRDIANQESNAPRVSDTLGHYNQDSVQSIAGRSCTQHFPLDDALAELQKPQEQIAQKPGKFRRMAESLREGEEERQKIIQSIEAKCFQFHTSCDQFNKTWPSVKQNIIKAMEAQESAHQAIQSVLPKTLDVLEKINHSCDETKQKVDEVLEATQLEISSNELTQKEMIQQLQDTQNTLKEIVTHDILNPIDSNLSIENTEISNTLTLLGTLDQV